MKLLAGTIIGATGAYLIALALIIAVRPRLGERFLKAFASSARAHYVEQAVRLAVGTALVAFSPFMAYPYLFKTFGWVIVATTAGLLLIPWQWHHQFSQWAIPLALRNLRLFALGAFFLGALVLFGVSHAIYN